MTNRNQMPELPADVLTIRDFRIEGKISHIYLTSMQHEHQRFIRADLAQKTVTRDELEYLIRNYTSNPLNRFGGAASLVDYLIQSGVVKVSE